MKLAGRWFIFVFFFTIDVRVKASDGLVERPRGCLNHKSICALQTKDEVFHFSNPELEFHLSQNALTLKHNSSELEFAQGSLWVAKYQKMKVRTIYGEVVAKSGPFWVVQAEDKIWIRNINADLKLKTRDGHQLELPIGFQIWLGGVDLKGKSTFGIPEVIPFEEHIRLWSQLFPGTKENFKSEVESLRWTWGPINAKAAQLYTDMALREQRIAAAKAAELQRRRLATEEERRMFRALYIKKAFWQ